MTIIPAYIQQINDGSLCWLAVLWVNGVLTSISGEEPRSTRNGASRAAWRAGRSLYAAQPKSKAVVLRRFERGEEERLMAGGYGMTAPAKPDEVELLRYNPGSVSREPFMVGPVPDGQWVALSDHVRILAARTAQCAEVGVTDALAIIDELLCMFTHEGYPGEPCVQTGWIPVKAIKEYRARREAIAAAIAGNK